MRIHANFYIGGLQVSVGGDDASAVAEATKTLAEELCELSIRLQAAQDAVSDSIAALAPGAAGSATAMSPKAKRAPKANAVETPAAETGETSSVAEEHAEENDGGTEKADTSSGAEPAEQAAYDEAIKLIRAGCAAP